MNTNIHCPINFIHILNQCKRDVHYIDPIKIMNHKNIIIIICKSDDRKIEKVHVLDADMIISNGNIKVTEVHKSIIFCINVHIKQVFLSF